MMRRSITIPILLLAAGCGTSTLKIDTNPSGANVYAKTIGSSDRHLVGKTPIPRTLTKDIQKDQMGAMMLDIELENYLNTSVLIADTANAESEIYLQLKPIPVDKKAEDDKKSEEAKKSAETEKQKAEEMFKVNKNMDQLFEAQRLARVGRFDDSLKMLDEVGKVFPQWASVPEMRGGVYLLQKDYVKALDEYQKALALNSENTSSIAIIRNLEKKVGIKKDQAQNASSEKAATSEDNKIPDKANTTQ